MTQLEAAPTFLPFPILGVHPILGIVKTVRRLFELSALGRIQNLVSPRRMALFPVEKAQVRTGWHCACIMQAQAVTAHTNQPNQLKSNQHEKDTVNRRSVWRRPGYYSQRTPGPMLSSSDLLRPDLLRTGCLPLLSASSPHPRGSGALIADGHRSEEFLRRNHVL
jgi:hypothetical protein